LAFKEFLENGPKDLVKNSYLYIHTGYPDAGWKIPRLLQESGISHRVYFTYICRACGFIKGQKFCDVSINCPRCGQNEFGLTNPGVGVSSEIMAQIYNLMDVYVQYIINEGFGIPCIEAASCGVPVLCTDYSATEDFKETINAIPIKPVNFIRECTTNRYMPTPDKKDFIEKLIDILKKPSPIRINIGRQARLGCEKYYNAKKICENWMNTFDELDYINWYQPQNIYNQYLNLEPPFNLRNDEFVRWCIINVANEPKLINSYLESKMIRDLNYGFREQYQSHPYFNDLSMLGVRPNKLFFNKQNAYEEFRQFIENRNIWENKRLEAIR
jgi:hypothetical protein